MENFKALQRFRKGWGEKDDDDNNNPESDQLLILLLQHISGVKSFDSLDISQRSGSQDLTAEQLKTVLERLPVEILQNIAFFLPE